MRPGTFVNIEKKIGLDYADMAAKLRAEITDERLNLRNRTKHDGTYRRVRLASLPRHARSQLWRLKIHEQR